MKKDKQSVQSREERNYKKRHYLQIGILAVSFIVLGLLISLLIFSRKVDISQLDNRLNQATVIYDVNGKIASKITANKNEGVPIEKVPEHTKNAFIAIEDRRFYEHSGVDYKGILRALFQNVKAGDVVEGGSTITQQLTKNALLSSEKTYKRKLEEFFLAKEIEKNYSKDEIMEMYLNEIYFGKGAWGIKNAALKYFGKDVEDLTISESALLAGLVKAPSNLNPYDHIKSAINRRNVVLSQMKTFEFISEKEYTKAKHEQISLNDKGGDPLKDQYPYYVYHVLDEAIDKYHFTQDELLTGGYQIYTELDPTMQTAVEKTYENDSLFPNGTEKQKVQSGAILMDPKTGGIRALVGGRGDAVFRGFNRATQLKSQPGSTLKPIAAYTPALENGWNITDWVKDENIAFGDYKPNNYNNQYRGSVPMYEALQDSLNVPAVWILNEIGVEKGLEATRRFGIPLEEGDRNLSIALGGLEKGVAPIHMAEAYSVFANKGERMEAHAILKIVDSDGNVVSEWKEKKTSVITEAVAANMTTMLLGVVENGTGRGAQIYGREVAGKTGSTQVPIEGIDGVKDQWFVGYTPQLVGAVWVGYDKTDKDHYLTTTSSEGAAVIFKELMADSLANQENLSFNVPHIGSLIEQQRQEQLQEEQRKRAEEMKKNYEKEVEKWKRKIEKEKDKWKKKWKFDDEG